MKNRTHAAIDLKSFYTSVECVERGLDSLTPNLVDADASRRKSHLFRRLSLPQSIRRSQYRAGLFEVVQKVQEVNAARLRNDMLPL